MAGCASYMQTYIIKYKGITPRKMIISNIGMYEKTRYVFLHQLAPVIPND